MIRAIDLLDGLANEFRQSAEVLREHGAEGEAVAVEACARRVEGGKKRYLDEPILLSEAAAELGRSDRYLRDQVKEGKLRSASRDGPIRVRRRDLYTFAGNGGEG